MKNESVKTVSIYMDGCAKPKWIFDVSDKTAEKIIADLRSDDPVLTIQNVPTKAGLKSLHIMRSKIDYVEVE